MALIFVTWRFCCANLFSTCHASEGWGLCMYGLSKILPLGNPQINLTLVQFACARGCRDSACRVRLCFCYRTRHAVSLPCFCSLLLANFDFLSLIHISEASPRRYSRSDFLKCIWKIIHLSVSLYSHLVPEGCEAPGLRWECSENLRHYPMLWVHSLGSAYTLYIMHDI